MKKENKIERLTKEIVDSWKQYFIKKPKKGKKK